MAIRVTCSSCDKSYSVDDALRGKKIRCRECKEVFAVPAGAAPASPRRNEEDISERRPVPAGRRDEDDEDDLDEDDRPRNRRRRAEEDDDDDTPRNRRRRVEDDDEDERPRRKKKAKSSVPLALIIGGGVGLIVLIGAVVAVILILRGGGNNPVAQGKPAPNPGKPQAQAPMQPQAQPPGPVGVDDLGEKVLPANGAPNDAPLRHPKGIPLYKLSDLRIGAGRGPGSNLTVHYERVAGEEPGLGPTLIIRTPDGNEHPTIGGFGPFQGKRKAGDIVVSLGFRSGVPKDVEVYLVHMDRRWEGDGFRPRFKVSNSVVLGTMGRPVQYAREWTPEEAAKINDPPPEAPRINANSNVGENTEFIGHTAGLLPPMRYADLAKRPVIGILFRTGTREPDKNNAPKVKVKCLTQLDPAYDKRQPRYNLEAVFAKPGYAVGGLNVKTKEVVTAVQVIFMKLKPDGTLDPADKYTSNWVGHPEESDKEGTLTGNGRKVIGTFVKNFGAVYAVALVLE